MPAFLVTGLKRHSRRRDVVLEGVARADVADREALADDVSVFDGPDVEHLGVVVEEEVPGIEVLADEEGDLFGKRGVEGAHAHVAEGEAVAVVLDREMALGKDAETFVVP